MKDSKTKIIKSESILIDTEIIYEMSTEQLIIQYDPDIEEKLIEIIKDEINNYEKYLINRTIRMESNTWKYV